MKKTTSKFFTAFVVMACVAMFVSCEKDIKHCTADKPYYCKNSSDKGCCAYQWTDNHGSCYNTLEYCRQTGWNCTACYKED